MEHELVSQSPPIQAENHPPKFDHKFTPEQIEEFKEIFTMYDEDGGGSISTEELGKVMRNLGQNPTEEELKDIIQEIDQDGNGEIDFDEFLILMAKNARDTDIMDDYRETFDLFDRDRDGFISAEDLKFFMKREKEPLTDEEAEEMIREGDKDDDGRITFDEFVEMMTLCSNVKDPNKSGLQNYCFQKFFRLLQSNNLQKKEKK